MNAETGPGELLPLLNPLYEAGLDDGALPQFLDGVAMRFGVETAVLAHTAKAAERPSILASRGPEPSALLESRPLARGGRATASCASRAPWPCDAPAWPEPSPCPARVEEVLETDALEIAWTTQTGDRFVLAIRLGPETAAPERVRNGCRDLVPHMARMLDLRARIGRSELIAEMTTATLDLLPFAFLVIEDDGYIVLLNDVAENALDRGDGPTVADGKVLGLDDELARLAAEDGSPDAFTAEAEADADGSRIGEGRLLGFHARTAGVRRHGFLVPMIESTRGSAKAGYRPRKLILFFDEPLTERQISGQALRDLFGLTPAEARLLGLVMAGHSVAEACEALAISSNTAKTHMRNLLGKTETASQTDLVRLALKSPVAHGPKG